MSNLPVSGKSYFDDYSSELVSFDIERNGKIINTLFGLPNNEKGTHYVHFIYGADINVGDVLCNGSIKQTVVSISIDTYLGKPDLLMAVV